MVRSTKSSPESRIDFGHQLFDVSRFGNHLDFVDEQALPILIESLTLSEPEEFLPVNDQARISAAARVDSYRIQRMRSPICIKRRIGREQIQLGTVIQRSRFVQTRQHPPFASLLEKHGIGCRYPLHDNLLQFPFQGEFRAAVNSDLPRFETFRAHVKPPFVLEQERKR